MDWNLDTLEWTRANLLWFIMEAAAVVDRIHPTIYYSMLASSLGATLAIRFGPSRLRVFFAGPFLPLFAASVWLSFQGRPELLSLAAMASCPLMLWGARSFGDDPMREELMGMDPGEPR